MNRKIIAVAAILFFVMTMIAIGPTYAAKKVSLTWTAGGTGGGWYVLAAGIAKLIKEKAPHIDISVIPGGGTGNQPVVGENKAEMGFGMPPFIIAARNGSDPYKKKFPDIRSIGGMFSVNYLHFIAAEDTGVTSIKDAFKTKPMNLSPTKKGSSGEFTFRKIMEDYFHTSYSEIKNNGGKVYFIGYSGISTNMKDRHIDFTCINIAPPAAIIQELALGRKLKILPFPEDLRQLMHTKYGYGLAYIKKDMYPDVLNQDIPTVTTGTSAMCHKSVDPDVVYQITKILCENKSRLLSIHKSTKVFEPATAWKNMPAPLHPGAERYYKEKGYMK